ncbi:MAG TPA: hypothetical protein VND62_03285 [Acidimicrobiales bacterium]|nr:hypothetical protein [Acidimicrobiales bacterium]
MTDCDPASLTPPTRMADRPELERLVAVPTGAHPRAAVDVDGWDLGGRPKYLRLTAPGCWTLLLFLGAHCDGCLPFWAVPGAPASCGLAPQDVAAVVTRGPAHEALDRLAILTADHPEAADGLVMSDAAWLAYGVLGAPFFVLLDGTAVVTEGVAWSHEQVAADVGRARRRGGREADGSPRARR